MSPVSNMFERQTTCLAEDEHSSRHALETGRGSHRTALARRGGGEGAERGEGWGQRCSPLVAPMVDQSLPR